MCSGSAPKSGFVSAKVVLGVGKSTSESSAKAVARFLSTYPLSATIHRTPFSMYTMNDEHSETYSINADGEINILDLVLVAQAIGETDSEEDVNGDSIVNVLDLVLIASRLSEA